MRTLFLLSICLLVAFTSCHKRPVSHKSVINPLSKDQCIQTLTRAIVADNREAVAEMVEYPFPQPYPLKSILNEQEFIMHYDRIICPNLCKELQKSTA